jgi:magnesium transporter
MAFELEVLEALLIDVSRDARERVSLFRPVLDAVVADLSDLTVEQDQSLLHRLLPIKESLQELESSTSDVMQAFSRLVEDEEDMLRMLLTETHAVRAARCDPSETQAVDASDPFKLPPRARHLEVELLLEGYLSQMRDSNQEAAQLLRSIQSAQEVAELALSSYRNRILRLNARATIGMLGLAASTLVGGLFGMNLQSGLESHPHAFKAAVASSLAATAAIVAGGNAHIARGSDRDRARLRDIDEVRDVMSRMGSLQKSLDWRMLSPESAPLNKAEFKRVLDGATRRPVTDAEIDAIFRVYDTDKDGRLSPVDLSFVAKGR